MTLGFFYAFGDIQARSGGGGSGCGGGKNNQHPQHQATIYARIYDIQYACKGVGTRLFVFIL